MPGAAPLRVLIARLTQCTLTVHVARQHSMDGSLLEQMTDQQVIQGFEAKSQQVTVNDTEDRNFSTYMNAIGVP